MNRDLLLPQTKKRNISDYSEKITWCPIELFVFPCHYFSYKQ
jgi:hypothetical protein